MTQRIFTGSLLVAGALLLLYFGGVVFALTGIVCICFALYEEYRALNKAGHRPVSWPTWVAMATSVPLALLLGAQVVIPILMGASLLTILCVVFRKDPRLEDALMSLLPLYAVLLPGLCIISLALVQPLSLQRTLLGMLIAVPVLGDTLAFFVGSKVGGPKLCPAVSPNKTISGAVAGLVGSLLAAVLIRLVSGWMVVESTRAALPSWWMTMFMGLIGGLASQLGDLFASLVKRHCQIKDFSDLFPGHGGMLDRLDSIFFMSIVMFCYRIMIS